MTRWEQLQTYLFGNHIIGGTFTSRDYAAATGIAPWQASDHIQAFLAEQRRPESKALYVLKREPGTRTASTQWSVGHRTKDLQAIGVGFTDDVRNRFMHAIGPDMQRIAVLNPHAAKRAEATIHAVVDGALVVLDHAIRGIEPEAPAP